MGSANWTRVAIPNNNNNKRKHEAGRDVRWGLKGDKLKGDSGG